MKIKTPYYLIDERKLLRNLKTIESIRNISGAKFVLALKCFSTWGVFNLMKKYMDGTTSSSLYETRLGREKFGKETHSYCVGYSEDDIREIRKYADKVIFNSISQLRMHHKYTRGLKLGLRVNPGFSYSHFDLADPARKYSRLGVTDFKALMSAAPLISGVMFHFNCENDSFENLSRNLDILSRKYGKLLDKLEWISIGGGLYFTKAGYPARKFAQKLKEFS
jgi:carboxynorspermidine decarboxylase